MSIKKYIPDCITSMNLVCGVLGVVCAFGGKLDMAFLLMLAGAVFDFCDGSAARLLGAYSDLGKELDSLSDLVTFGVLPATMMYNLMRSCTFSNGALCLVPLLIAVFTGIRLARFNVDERQHLSFIGLASPVSALICGSLCYYVACEPASTLAIWCGSAAFIPAVSVVLCALLVCPLPMFSMKITKDDSKALKTKRISLLAECVVTVAIVLVLGFDWSLAALLCCTIYVLKNIIYSIFSI
ncbi:MAG: CDP-diacylglycerol--serine O-phosphatidyltransferase [Bacteroidales bacterium]|nr:CDP-diacylglycerol--serine O-phosphatidyltransferase [Candidatus Cryptobacteroides aphodequi]